ncbi:MAG: hypothetical protein FWD45_00125, partial [Coriobacteriia bacterium]|nr:hypothetical protein [Coriobacteriia bacterium]
HCFLQLFYGWAPEMPHFTLHMQQKCGKCHKTVAYATENGAFGALFWRPTVKKLQKTAES